MFRKQGLCLGIFYERQNKEGETYYELTLEDYLLFLFSDLQYWYGISTEARHGHFMYRRKTNEDLKPLGTWRKQKDGTLFIDVSNDTSSGGYVAEMVGNEFWIYEAEGTNSLEILILNNKNEK
jgi:hypothetical protein